METSQKTIKIRFWYEGGNLIKSYKQRQYRLIHGGANGKMFTYNHNTAEGEYGMSNFINAIKSL